MVRISVRTHTKPFPIRQSYGGIAALSPIFDVAFYCGRYIKITNTGGGLKIFGGGNEILVTVADTCDDCAEADLGKSLNSLFNADLQLLKIATVWTQAPSVFCWRIARLSIRILQRRSSAFNGKYILSWTAA
jgi:hypothetical protein